MYLLKKKEDYERLNHYKVCEKFVFEYSLGEMQFGLKTYFLTLIVVGMKKPSSKKLRQYFLKKSFIIAAFGLLLALLSIISYFAFPPILKLFIQNVMNLKPGGEFHNWWLAPSRPTEVAFNFFHVENPYDVQMGSDVIKVKEMGTYMFK